MSKKKKKPVYSTVKRFRKKDSGQWWPERPFEDGETVLLNGVPNKVIEIKRQENTITPIKEGKIGKFLEAKPTEIEIEFDEEITITGIKIKIK